MLLNVVKIEQSGLSSEPSITGLSTKKWNRLNFLEAYNHLKWKCFMTLGPVFLGRLNWFRRQTLFYCMLSDLCICFGSCDVQRRNQRQSAAVIPGWARHEKRLSRSKFNKPFRTDIEVVLHINRNLLNSIQIMWTSTASELGLRVTVLFFLWSDKTFLGNCPPTPPASQHFALSEKQVLMLA